MASITFSSADDLADIVKIQLSSLSSLITADGYEFVCFVAEQELGWLYPVTDPTRQYWLINRATRHALNILRIASANKFKYKQVNLQNRFEHFDKLIQEMDEEYNTAMNTNVALFAGVDTYRMFGTKIDAGFSYGIDGSDTTYDVDRYVNFAPIGG